MCNNNKEQVSIQSTRNNKFFELIEGLLNSEKIMFIYSIFSVLISSFIEQSEVINK